MLVIGVLAICFGAGLDALRRLAVGDAADIGLSFEAALVVTVVCGALLVVTLDGVRRNYVIFRTQELHLQVPPERPKIVGATGAFESHRADVFRYLAPSSIREAGPKLLLVTPPEPVGGGAAPAALPASPVGDDDLYSTIEPGSTARLPLVEQWWIEIDARRVVQVDTGRLCLGFTDSPAVRFTLIRSGKRRQVHVSARTDGEARWLFESIDRLRASIEGS